MTATGRHAVERVVAPVTPRGDLGLEDVSLNLGGQ